MKVVSAFHIEVQLVMIVTIVMKEVIVRIRMVFRKVTEISGIIWKRYIEFFGLHELFLLVDQWVKVQLLFAIGA